MTMHRALLLIIACLGATSPTGAREAGESALRQLDATVQKSCACAAGQDSGVRAALACTENLKTFGKIKLEFATRWTTPQKQRAARIERIVETCLSEALGYRRTLARLGIEAPFPPPPRPPPLPTKPLAPFYWQQIHVSQLNQYPSRLARIATVSGESVKGLVRHLDTQTLQLMRARSDGGGLLRFKLSAIRSAWVLLPSP